MAPDSNSDLIVVKQSGSIAKGTAITFSSGSLIGIYSPFAFDANCKDFSSVTVFDSTGAAECYYSVVLISSKAIKNAIRFLYSGNSFTFTLNISDYDYINITKESPQSENHNLSVTFN